MMGKMAHGKYSVDKNFTNDWSYFVSLLSKEAIIIPKGDNLYYDFYELTVPEDELRSAWLKMIRGRMLKGIYPTSMSYE